MYYIKMAWMLFTSAEAFDIVKNETLEVIGKTEIGIMCLF